MKKTLSIALLLLLLSGCSKDEHSPQKLFFSVMFDGKPEGVIAAKSITADRHCVLHGDALSYTLIKRQWMLVDAVVDFERMRREELFRKTRAIAPNAIPLSPDWIISQNEYHGGRIIPPEGTDDLIYEYCRTCERIMQETLKKSAPNQPLQTMTMTAPVAAEPLCGPAIVMSDR